MIPGPIKAVEEHLESAQADMDVDERIRALTALETGLRELLGRTRTYLNDSQLEKQGADPEQPGATEG